MRRNFRIANFFLMTTIFSAVFFLFIGTAKAAVTITTATGGTNISADKAVNAVSPAYTTLGNIVITEVNNNDITTNGTFTVAPPTGWTFSTSTPATTSVTGGLTATVNSQTASLLTITIGGRNNGAIQSFTIIGLQVIATDGASLPSSGNITRAGGTATISGAAAGAILGALSQTYGAKTKLGFTTQASATSTVGTNFTIKPVVKVQDQFGNTVTSDSTSTINLAAVKYDQVCGGTLGAGTLSSTPASGSAVSSGVMSYSAMSYSYGEPIKICASSTGLTSALSDRIVIAPTITNVTASNANGTYGVGQTIHLQVVFSSPVTVTGTPQLILTTGSPATTSVNYLSGSGGTTLNFDYIVASGNTSADLDYASTGALILNGGTIKDTAYSLTDAVLTLASPGAAGSLGANKNIVIDSTPPAAPSTPDLAAVDDTGVSNSDNITKQSVNLTFSGTAEASSTVELFDGLVSKGTTIASSGNWSFTITLLPGTHTMAVTATDGAGNKSATSSALTVVVDQTAPSAPSIPDLAAADDSGISNTDNLTNHTSGLTFSGTAEASSTVELFDGVISKGTSVATSGNWALDISLTAGNHNISAKTTDLAGNVSSSSEPILISIDTSSPAAPLAPDLAAADDIGFSDTDNITKLTSGLTFTGVAAEDGVIELFNGAVSAGTTTVTAGAWTKDISLSAGSHSISAVLTDSAGNVSSSSEALSITIDTTPPNVPSVPDLDAADDTGISNTDNITKQISNDTFTGTADVGSKVELFRLKTDNEYFYGGSVIATDGTWSFNMFINPGTYSLWTMATDVAGNTSATSSSLVVTVDTAVNPSPSAPDLAAADDTGISNTDNITNKTTGLTFTGTVEASSTVEIFDNSSSVATTTAVSGSYSFDLNLAEGDHSLDVVATDVAGNVSSTSLATVVTVDTTIPVTPTSPNLDSDDDTGISNSDNITKLSSGLTFYGTGEIGTTAEIYDGDSLIASTTVASITQTIDLSLSEGVHGLSVVCVDTAGNRSATSSKTYFTIDTTAPSAPSTPDLDPNDDTGISNTDHITKQSAALTFSGTAEASSTIELFYDGSNSKGTTFTSTGDWSYSVSLFEGTHSITAVAYDIAGNKSATSSASSLVVDLTQPNIPSVPDLAAADDDGVSNTDNVTSLTSGLTFSGTADASSTVELFAGAISIGTTSVSTGGAWTVDNVSLSAGTYNITAVTTDVAGNNSYASDALTVETGAADFATPSAPDLDAEDDSGISNSDNITKHTSNLTFTGSAETDSTVILYDGANSLATTTATLGNYLFNNISLSAGVHSLSVYSSNATSSATSTSLLLTIDNSAPSAPTSAGLDSSCDTGLYDNDNITKNTSNLTGSGTAEASSTVELFLDGISRGTVPVSGSGDWTFAGSIPAGTHSLYTIAIDTAGNHSASSTLVTIIVDTTAPDAPSAPDLAAEDDTGISNTDNITKKDTELTFSGTTEASSTIEIFDGVTSKGSVFSTTTNWTKDLSLSAGTYYIVAKATDLAGNISGASDPTVVVIVDTTAPDAPSTPDLDPSDDTGFSNTDNITKLTSGLTFNGTAEPDSFVELFDGAVSLGTTTTVADAWTIDVSLTAGDHSITAVAIDKAGNTSATSSPLSITIDTTPPNVPSVPDLDAADDTGISNTDNITKQISNDTFTGTADVGSKVELFRLKTDNEYFYGGSVIATDGTWSFNMFINPGTYSLWTMATDVAGNTSATSSSLVVTVDTAVNPSPSAPDLAAADDTGISNTDNITNKTAGLTFTGTVEANSVVEIFDNNISQATTTAVSGNYSFDLNLAAGNHEINVNATDVAGNLSTTSAMTFVTVDTTTPITPSTPNLDSSDDTGLSNSDGVTKLTSGLTIFGTAETGSLIEIFDGATLVGTTTMASSSDSLDISLAEGVHSLIAVSTDPAGNRSASSSALSLTVDTTAPAIPSAPDFDNADDTGISNTDNITKQTANLTITGMVETGSSVEFYLDGGLRGLYPSTDGNWIVEGSITANGPHIFNVKAVDLAGNTSATSSSLTVTIDTALPELAQVTPVPTLTNDRTPNYTFHSTEAGTITYSGTAGCNSSTTTAIAGDNLITFNTLANGNYSCEISVTDTAGNISSVLYVNNFTVDGSAPTLAEVTPVPALTNNATPSYTFDSTEAGTITYSGTSGCTSLTTSAVAGNNTITFNTLNSGSYSCGLKVTDAAGNQSDVLNVRPFTVDLVSPFVSDVTSPTANGTYNQGYDIPVQIHFSEDVVVTGTPQLSLSTGSPTSTPINYSYGSGSNILTFNYIVGANNISHDLDYSSTGALTLNGGAIKDEAGNNAALTLAAPGTAGSLGANKNIVVEYGALVIDINAPVKVSSTTISNTTITVTDIDGIDVSDVSIATSSTVSYENFVCEQTDANTVDCNIDITGSGNLVIKAIDDLEETLFMSENGYVINPVTPEAPVANKISSAPIMIPASVGDGENSIAINFGESKTLPALTSSGTNILMYPNSTLYINNHRISIVSLDLYWNVAVIKIESDPVLVKIKLGETASIDINGDKINDISIKFSALHVNLMDLTIKQLAVEKKAVVKPAVYDLSLANKLKGKILIQTDKRGEAWYVNPQDGQRYYLAGGNEAYQIMRKFGVGIGNNNLAKLKKDKNFRKKFFGKIFLQVEAHGEAYYVGFDNNLYYLKDGAAAYSIMRKLGLGITTANLEKIPEANLR